MGNELLAIGLMSGTSADGIDAALIETDGENHVRPVAFHAVPYTSSQRQSIRQAMTIALEMTAPQPHEHIDKVTRELTQRHGEAVDSLMRSQGLQPQDIAIVGFHGQTVAHRPDRGWTWQIGDGAGLAQQLGIPVVCDFRSADVAAGGQGAPLVPAYHRALARRAGLQPPVAFLNLGGVGNVTWIGRGDDDLVAFDTGPANALIDDWMLEHTDKAYDKGGAIAATGQVHSGILATLMDNPWFSSPPPKSLDRADFSLDAVRGLSLADGATTLTAFTAQTVQRAMQHLPEPPSHWLVAGGGRHNATLMAMLAQELGDVRSIDTLGWNGDALEAEAFAYLAVRSLKGLALSYPGTTGVSSPQVGGTLFPLE